VAKEHSTIYSYHKIPKSHFCHPTFKRCTYFDDKIISRNTSGEYQTSKLSKLCLTGKIRARYGSIPRSRSQDETDRDCSNSQIHQHKFQCPFIKVSTFQLCPLTETSAESFRSPYLPSNPTNSSPFMGKFIENAEQ